MIIWCIPFIAPFGPSLYEEPMVFVSTAGIRPVKSITASIPNPGARSMCHPIYSLFAMLATAELRGNYHDGIID
jgi:hypothetical protein